MFGRQLSRSTDGERVLWSARRDGFAAVNNDNGVGPGCRRAAPLSGWIRLQYTLHINNKIGADHAAAGGFTHGSLRSCASAPWSGPAEAQARTKAARVHEEAAAR